MDEQLSWAYSVLSLESGAGLHEIKKRYKTLAKKYHPDITREENESIRDINSAYKIVIENYYKEKTENICESSSYSFDVYAFIVKGIRLAMKQYVSGLSMAKIKGDFRAGKLEEIFALLSHLENIAESERTSLYYTFVIFLRSIIDFEMTTIYIKAENALERKAHALYSQMIKDTVIVLEEIFSRLDNVKKMASLWRQYAEKALEEYKDLQNTGEEKYINAAVFIPDLMEVLKDVYEECRKDKSFMAYKDFYELFDKEKNKNKT